MLTDAELMKRHDSRISEADLKTLIIYWRSSVFEVAVRLCRKDKEDQEGTMMLSVCMN